MYLTQAIVAIYSPISGQIQQMTNWSYFSSENRIWYFMQIVSIEDNLHEKSNPVF